MNFLLSIRNLLFDNHNVPIDLIINTRADFAYSNDNQVSEFRRLNAFSNEPDVPTASLLLSSLSTEEVGIDMTLENPGGQARDTEYISRSSWPLHLRFAAAGSVVVLVGMMLIGWWVGSKIEHSFTRNSAISTALYMESFIAPLAQELASKDVVSPETSRALHALARQPHLRERVPLIKLWKEDGLVAFSTDPDLIGQRFEPEETLKAAWRGELTSRFSSAGDGEHADEEFGDLPILEVYNPIHSVFDPPAIIAVAEFYEDATQLQNDLFDARLRSWLIVAGVSMGMFALLFSIVYQGSQLIEQQRSDLEKRVNQILQVSLQNELLRRRIQAASARASELNERYLRRISAELHDGPAQSVAFASLRINSLAQGESAAGQEATRIKSALDEALGDIRNICRGLSLPELESSNLEEVVTRAARAHEKRTNQQIDLVIVGKPDREYDHPARICVFRFLQETLNNASRHANAEGIRVLCIFDQDQCTITVSDTGPGFSVDDPGQAFGLGLRGLRERIESHGGSFHINSAPGRGTTIRMTIDAKENGDAK